MGPRIALQFAALACLVGGSANIFDCMRYGSDENSDGSYWWESTSPHKHSTATPEIHQNIRIKRARPDIFVRSSPTCSGLFYRTEVANCGRCVSQPGCGFCLSTLSCANGTETGPLSFPCPQWRFDEPSSCPEVKPASLILKLNNISERQAIQNVVRDLCTKDKASTLPTHATILSQ